MRARRTRGPVPWILVTGVVVGAALVWILPTLSPQGKPWNLPAKVTAFGLLFMVAVVIIALASNTRSWQEMDRDRIARKQRRRAKTQPLRRRTPKSAPPR